MIVAGIGCRRGTSADQIEAVISAALTQAGLERQQLVMIATAALKGGERGIMDAAAACGVPLVLVPQEDLAAAGARTVSFSERVVAIAGVPSVAEAAALAAAGAAARLIGSRIAVGPATCALAQIGEASP
jgi:cobalt-precorrin 5A hydrolase